MVQWLGSVPSKHRVRVRFAVDAGNITRNFFCFLRVSQNTINSFFCVFPEAICR